VQVLPEALVKLQETAHFESGDHEGHAEASGIDGEEKDAAGDGAAGSSKSENAVKDRAEAGRPAEREREAEKEGTPQAGPGDRGTQMHIAIQPAGQGRAKKEDERKREEVQRVEIGEQRGVAEEAGYAECREDGADDDAGTKI